jgi:phenylpropionate dioxygenase-like ring-hydroxylating dioxygenase large terminal subunit
LGAPFEKEMYGDWDKSRLGLGTARVALEHGIIYATFNHDGPSLEAHLGELAWYHDVMYGGVEWEPTGPPMRMDIRSNWKAAADQNAGDIYHVFGAHKAASELQGNIGDAMFVSAIDLVKVNFPEGHNLFAIGSGSTRRSVDDPETVKDDRYTFEGVTYSQLMFPANTGGGGAGPQMGMPGGARTALLGWYVPRGPRLHELYHLQLIEKGATEDQKSMARKGNMIGNATLIDDVDTWQSIQRASEGAMGQRRTMKYPATQPINKPSNWPGPGDVRAGFSRDDTHWYFWEAWFDAMTADEA